MTTADTQQFARSKRNAYPVVRRITIADLLDAISKGLSDFNAMPTHYFFVAIIYPILMFSIAGFYGQLNLLPILFPLVAGYTILGPLVATGLYELSRRREFGRYTSRTNAFLVFKSHSISSIAILGILLMVVYFLWLFLAQLIYVEHFGTAAPESYLGFAKQILTTPEGFSMITIGSVVGLIFSIVVMSISVISFPLLLDFDVGIWTAVSTSVKAVIINPIVMAVWGLIVALALFAGALPFFIGLGIVLPVLGHATWHVYRKAIDT